MTCSFTVGRVALDRNNSSSTAPTAERRSRRVRARRGLEPIGDGSFAPQFRLRNADTVRTLSEPMSRMHLNAYFVPAASRAAGTSRCLWSREARPTSDPRSGV
jgi:hypothetical protein